MQKIYLILIVLMAFLSACSNLTTEDNVSRLQGVITDSNNNPLINCRLFVSYYSELQRPETSISFHLSEAGPVKAWVSHHNEDDTVKVLINDVTGAGNHVASWNARNTENKLVASNYYDVHLTSSETNLTKKLFFNNVYVLNEGTYNDFEYVSQTNSQGFYSIDVNKLACSYADNSYQSFDINGNPEHTYRVSRYIKLYAYCPGYQAKCIDSLYISPGKIIKQDLVLN